MDIEQFSLIVMQQVKAYVQPAIDALAQRIDDRESAIIAALDKKLAELPAPTLFDPDQVRAIVAESVHVATPDLESFTAEIRAMVAAIPVPQDGKSVTPEDLRPMLAEEVAKAVAALPVPRDGESVTLEQVQPMVDAAVKSLPPAINGKDADPVDMAAVAELVTRAVAELPKPADGASVTLDDVRPMVEEFLAAIPVPKDGESVTIEDMRHQLEAVVESKQASWELQFERRAQDRLQSALDRIPVPKDGKDGKDGADAIDIDGLSFELKDGGRILVASLKRGEHVKTCELVTEFPVYREQWKEGQEYVRGDEVTFAGSTWIARSVTQSRPETDDTWKLRTKRGRDGKDGRNGIDKTAPVKLS